MSHILEIIRIKVNDKFTSEPNLFIQLRAGAQKGGVKEQLYGLTIEKPDELTWLLLFEKPEDRTNFTWPEDHGYFNVKIAEITAGEFKPETMPVDSNTWNMMASAPIAEFTYVPIKSGVTQQEANPVMDAVIVAAKEAVGGHGGNYGVTIEDAKKFVIIAGWDSIEAHRNFQGTDVCHKVVFGGILSIVEGIEVVEYWHIPLEKH